jgi:diguanylate cyclase (GGDEF)-like protein/PAS domain S-box-containing protein
MLLTRQLWDRLPRGSALPEDVWARRHHGILVLLWLHVPVLFGFALAAGESVLHGVADAGGVAALAAAATRLGTRRRLSTVVASVGLLTCSAALVHLNGGIIEMHFHYFVMVGVVTLYQDWRPFLVAIGYVVVQHGGAGALWPESVFNHPAAIEHPWAWAGIHGLFILGMSAVGIVTWRLNETLLDAASDREERLAEAQAVARLGSWDWNLESGEVTWSDQLYRLFGADPGRFMPSYEAFLSRVHPEDRAAVVAAVEGMARGGVPLDADFRVVLDDGSVRWLHGRATVTGWAAGRPAVVSGTALDVTDRRRSEDALRDSEERFRAVTETASDAIVSADSAGRIVYFNRQAERLFGYQTSEAVGAPLALLMPPRYRAAHRSGLARLLTAGDARIVGTTVELVGRRRDGTEFPLELSLGSWRGAGQTFFTGIIRDITERKQAEAELRETLSLLSATLDATADGILVVDRDGRITSFNHKFCAIWRIPDSVLESRDDAAALAFVLQQLRDPETFLTKVRELYSQPEAESFDIIHFADGRVLERSSTPQRVEGAVVGRVWSFRDVTERKLLEDELAHQAFHDPLTNLANQALFRDRVDHSLARAQRRTDAIAVVFIDLDNFKRVNDSLGHPAGDRLLVAVSERLVGCLRPADTAARLGGDEFAVLIEDITGRRDATEVAERILKTMALPFTIAGKDVFIGASIGVAFGTPDARSEQLLRNADLAMYTAKSNGKSRYEVFEPAMHAMAVERLEMEADLRTAGTLGQLVVHYQPIVDLGTGEVPGVEALVRWRHPVRGLLSPAAFIPLAEETGLIHDVGRFVLASACGQARRIQRHHPGEVPLSVSVNLSPGQLLNASLVDDVIEALEGSGLPPSSLILEITEGAMMHDTEATIRTLAALKQLGVRLAVDDFGMGYSSLSYLQRFPVDILKIDRSFVEGIDQGAEESALARAILRLAETLQLTAIAEGVETATQAHQLDRMGCHLAQGYYLARPLDGESLTEALARPRPFADLLRGEVADPPAVPAAS